MFIGPSAWARPNELAEGAVKFNFIRHRLLAGLARVATVGVAAAGLGGCASIAGYKIVQNRVLVAGGQVQAVLVECPIGTSVLGGGFSIETPDDIKVYSSIPADGRGNLTHRQWEVGVKNVGTATRQTTAVAICAEAK
jgi:hypothetical protein